MAEVGVPFGEQQPLNEDDRRLVHPLSERCDPSSGPRYVYQRQGSSREMKALTRLRRSRALQMAFSIHWMATGTKPPLWMSVGMPLILMVQVLVVLRIVVDGALVVVLRLSYFVFVVLRLVADVARGLREEEEWMSAAGRDEAGDERGRSEPSDRRRADLFEKRRRGS